MKIGIENDLQDFEEGIVIVNLVTNTDQMAHVSIGVSWIVLLLINYLINYLLNKKSRYEYTIESTRCTDLQRRGKIDLAR